MQTTEDGGKEETHSHHTISTNCGKYATIWNSAYTRRRRHTHIGPHAIQFTRNKMCTKIWKSLKICEREWFTRVILSLAPSRSSFALVRVHFSLTKRIRIECMICRHIVWLHQLHFGSDCCLNGNVMIIILRWHRKKFLNILCWLQNKSSGMSIKIVSTGAHFLFLQETDMENEWNV